MSEDLNELPDVLPQDDPNLQDPNEGKTDRYIVKYKDGRAASFEIRISSKLEAAVSLTSAEIR